MHRKILLALVMLPAAVWAQDLAPGRVEAVVAATFAHAPPGWASRVAQDQTQALCSATRNNPNAADAERIMAAAKASIVLPADGQVIGDWKRGEAIAQNGRGGQFSDEPGTINGGNCYACHKMGKGEISYGTLGPSLTNYGLLRDYDPAEARATFAKIFNSNAILACSTMPRFGANKVLDAAQIRDLVGFLFDPASPVNAP